MVWLEPSIQLRVKRHASSRIGKSSNISTARPNNFFIYFGIFPDDTGCVSLKPVARSEEGCIC